MNTSQLSRRSSRSERRFKRSLSTVAAGMFEDDNRTSRTMSPEQVSCDSSAASSDSMLQVNEENNGFAIDETCQDSLELILNTPPIMFYHQQNFEQDPRPRQSLLLPSIIVVPRSASSLPSSSILHRTMSFDEDTMSFDEDANERSALVSISSQDDDSFFVIEEVEDN